MILSKISQDLIFIFHRYIQTKSGARKNVSPTHYQRCTQQSTIFQNSESQSHRCRSRRRLHKPLRHRRGAGGAGADDRRPPYRRPNACEILHGGIRLRKRRRRPVPKHHDHRNHRLQRNDAVHADHAPPPRLQRHADGPQILQQPNRVSLEPVLGPCASPSRRAHVRHSRAGPLGLRSSPERDLPGPVGAEARRQHEQRVIPVPDEVVHIGGLLQRRRRDLHRRLPR